VGTAASVEFSDCQKSININAREEKEEVRNGHPNNKFQQCIGQFVLLPSALLQN